MIPSSLPEETGQKYDDIFCYNNCQTYNGTKAFSIYYIVEDNQYQGID